MARITRVRSAGMQATAMQITATATAARIISSTLPSPPSGESPNHRSMKSIRLSRRRRRHHFLRGNTSSGGTRVDRGVGRQLPIQPHFAARQIGKLHLPPLARQNHPIALGSFLTVIAHSHLLGCKTRAQPEHEALLVRMLSPRFRSHHASSREQQDARGIGESDGKYCIN